MMTKYQEQFRSTEAMRRRLEARLDERARKSGHGRPRSRRDFLGQGLIAGVGTVFLPSVATVLSRAAAAECVEAPMLGAGEIPFLAFDQGGGANIAGSNVMVGGAGGQEDFLAAEGYAKLGLPDAIIPQVVGVDRSFGLAMHPASALLRDAVEDERRNARRDKRRRDTGALGKRHG